MSGADGFTLTTKTLSCRKKSADGLNEIIFEFEKCKNLQFIKFHNLDCSLTIAL